MPRRPARLAVVAAALAAAACGSSPDLVVRGTAVYVETAAPFAHEPGFPARLEGTLDAALRYWGGSWRALEGATITLSGEPSVPCGGAAGALGCYDGDLRVTTADPGAGTFDCVEQTVLVHEVGHAVLGDARHQDPRWMQFETLAAALAGRTGWSDGGGEVECLLAPSVWRHPLGLP